MTEIEELRARVEALEGLIHELQTIHNTAVDWRMDQYHRLNQLESTQRAIDTSARVRRTADLYAKSIDPSMSTPWDEGRIIRGNNSSGPTTPKPDITPIPLTLKINHDQTAQGNTKAVVQP